MDLHWGLSQSHFGGWRSILMPRSGKVACVERLLALPFPPPLAAGSSAPLLNTVVLYMMNSLLFCLFPYHSTVLQLPKGLRAWVRGCVRKPPTLPRRRRIIPPPPPIYSR